uniref:Uncharacterized protein n=1 Tax=Acrobeloides nanus TaxID=290746 RepID=A0A914E7L7_9BILA
MQNYGNSFPSQGHNYARYMVDDDHRSERPPRPICKRPANLCHCLCDHNPDSTTICDCACCVNDAFVSHMLPSGLVQLDSLENFDITNLIPNEQNHDEDIVYGRRESPPNSSPETQNQCVNTSLPQHVPQPMTQNDYPYEDPNLSSGARSFPQPLRGRARGRPRSSNQPSAVYMRGFNANRSQRALFVQQLIQRLDEFRPEERQIIEELMAAAGIGHSASSQRGS